MHPAAREFVARHATAGKSVVVEIGSRDINGNVRDLFPNAKSYVGVNLADGRNVDVVADATTWTPARKANVVVCCEMIEHCDGWADVIVNIHDNMLAKNGRLILTAAGPKRAPHSGIDGGAVRPDEFYENILAADLAQVLQTAGFTDIEIDESGDDVRAVAVKGV